MKVLNWVLDPFLLLIDGTNGKKNYNLCTFIMNSCFTKIRPVQAFLDTSVYSPNLFFSFLVKADFPNKRGSYRS